MQRDGKAIIVHRPQFLEQHLRLAAGVDEHQRGLVLLDQLVDFAERMARRMSSPWQPFLRVQHLDDRRRTTGGDDEIGRRAAAGRLRHQERLSDSGSATVADRPIAVMFGAMRNSRASPSDSRSPRLDVTSACNSSSTIRFSDANRNGASSDASNSASCSGVVSRMSGGYAPLPLPPRHRRVAGAGFDPDRQLHLGDRPLEIARDVDRQRLQRRDVERMQTTRALHATPRGRHATGSGRVMIRGGAIGRATQRCLLPSPRARSAWRGGVGGGGQLSLEVERNLTFSGRFPQHIRSACACRSAHPRPLPAGSRREGRRFRSR